MDWEDLHAFIVFTQKKTLLATAQELGVQHTTVARRIENLEKSIGAPLLDRRAKKLELLPRAQEFFNEFTEIEQRIINFRKHFEQGNEKLKGKVVISTTSVLAEKVIAPELALFSQKYPEISIHLEAEDQITPIALKNADIAVRLGTKGDPNLIGKTVAHYAFGVYANQAYAKEIGRLKSSEELRRYDYIRLTETWRHLQQELWLSQTFGHQQPLFQMSQSLALAAALEETRAIAVLPCLVAEERRNLVRLLNQEKVVSIPIRVLAHRSWKSIPRVEKTLQFLNQVFLKARKRLDPNG